MEEYWCAPWLTQPSISATQRVGIQDGCVPGSIRKIIFSIRDETAPGDTLVPVPGCSASTMRKAVPRTWHRLIEKAQGKMRGPGDVLAAGGNSLPHSTAVKRF